MKEECIMAIPDSRKIYPRINDTQIVYLKNVVDKQSCPSKINNLHNGYELLLLGQRFRRWPSLFQTKNYFIV